MLKASERYVVRFVEPNHRERESDWFLKILDWVPWLGGQTDVTSCIVAIQCTDGREVARMSVTSTVAQQMYDRVQVDLETLSVEEFERECGIEE